MKTRTTNYSTPEEVKKKSVTQEKQSSIKGNNKKKVQFTQSVKNRTMRKNIQSKKVSESKQNQFKNKIIKNKDEGNTKHFLSDLKNNVVSTGKTRWSPKKGNKDDKLQEENDITLSKEKIDPIQDGTENSQESEIKETLNKPEMKKNYDVSHFNNDQFFIDKTSSISHLIDTVNKYQLEKFDETANDVKYRCKLKQFDSAFHENRKALLISNEKDTSKYDRNVTNELETKDKNTFDKQEICELKQDKVELNRKDLNEFDDDSDSSPEIQSFQSSRNKALNFIRNAEEETRRIKLDSKKLKRKYHERNLMQKEEKEKKLHDLQAKKLPQNILNNITMLGITEKTVPKEPKVFVENNKEHSNICMQEFVTVHGNTEFMVCRTENYLKKQSNVTEAAKDWKRCHRLGNKNKRESVKDMMSKKLKQSVSGKIMTIKK